MKNVYILTPCQVEELKKIKNQIESNAKDAVKDLTKDSLDKTILSEKLDNIIMLMEDFDELLELE